MARRRVTNADVEHLAAQALRARDGVGDTAGALTRCAGELARAIPAAERGGIAQALVAATDTVGGGK